MKKLITTLSVLTVGGALAAMPAPAMTTAHASTIRLLSSARIGDYPGGIARGFGSVWVADPLRDAVDRISLGTGHVQATIHTGGAPNFVAVGARAVWASNTSNASGTRPGSTVVLIDPRRDGVTRRIRVGPSPSQLTISGQNLWVAVTGRAAVVRVQLPSGRVRLTATELPAGGRPGHLVWVQGPVGIAVTGGSAWTGSVGVDALFRVDARSGRLNKAVPIGQDVDCGRMYAYGETIWASGECSPVIWRIDARTGRVRSTNLGAIPGPGLIGDAILARGSVWVTTDAGELLRINPTTGRVAGRYRLPSHLGAGSLTYTAGSLWESDFGDLDHGHGRVVQLALPR